MIEDSGQLDLVSLEAACESSWPNGELEAFRLGLMHGRLPPERKQEIMQAFRTGGNPGIGMHIGNRSRNRCAECHIDGYRKSRAFLVCRSFTS